jgi:hypothetical protein
LYNWQALHRFSITPAEYEAILTQIPKESSIESDDRIACDWLRANRNSWYNWVPVDDNERSKILIGGIFPMGGVVYTAKGIMAGEE